MKLSLRNLALGAAVAVAGVAVAQDAPVVTMDWKIEQALKDYPGYVANDMRFGTGYNGKVYTVDKVQHKLIEISPEGIKTVDIAAANGSAITVDQAGNILVNTDFPNAGSATNWLIIPADGSDVKELNLTMPEGITAARIDQMGRIVGDLLSEEGAIFYLPVNAAANVPLFYVQNGAQADLLDYMTTDGFSGTAINTSTVIQPKAENITEALDLGDDLVNYFYARNRSTNNASDYSSGEQVQFTLPTDPVISTTEGLDVFTLGDVTYQVLPAKQGGNHHTPDFVIADTEGNVIYHAQFETAASGGQTFGGFAAHKVSDNKVELYRYYNGNQVIAAMYTIEIPGEEPIAPLYAAGDFQGWSPENAAEFTYADGIYTLELTNQAIFKISTSKGSWDEFNAGVIGIAEDNQTVSPKFNTPVALTAGKLGNISVVAEGAFTVKVDLNAMTLEIVGTAPSYTYFADDFEWLAPWSAYVNDKGEKTGNTVGTNGASAYCPQLQTPKVDGKMAYTALTDKGYGFVTSFHASKGSPRDPWACTYLQENYLKFGLTGYYAGLVLPKIKTVPAGANIKLSFDYSTQKQGSGVWDETKLVVIVKNGEDVKTFDVPVKTPEVNGDYAWFPMEVELTGATINANTEITIRPCDEQWPSTADNADALRWYIDNISLTGDAEPLPVMPDLYLRGEFNEWGTTTPMTLTEEPVECIGAIYRLHLDELEAGEFKIANEDWSINRGADADPVVVLGTEMKAWNDGQNFKVEKKLVNVDITLFYKHDVSVNSILTVEGTVWEAPKHRAAMAYGLAISPNADDPDQFAVSFNATDEGKAVVVLTNQENPEDVVRIDLGEVVKGANTIPFSTAELPNGSKYNWAVEIISNIEGEAPVLVQNEAVPTDNTNGGIVTITDETAASYGYTVVGIGRANGFKVYNPEGELVGTYHQGFAGFDASNGSSPFRGSEREGLAVFADWSDKGAGYWVIDPLNPTNEPYNILAAPGATKNGAGLWTTAEGVATAGGTAAVAFQGKGDETVVYAFEEDRPDASNVVVAWPIGSAQYLTVAPKMIYSGKAATSEIPTNEGGVDTKNRLLNTNVDILAIENGFFCSQVRANGKEPGTPPFIYVSNDGQEIMNAGMEEIMESATAGIAITKDRSLFAASMNDAIRIFTVEWDETGFPVMTKLTDIEVSGLRWAHMRFDAANNLHVYARNIGYQVYALNGEGTSTTAAPAELAIAISRPEPKHRAAMAYDLSIADNGSDNYSVTFKSSDEGQAAIVLTNQADAEDVATIELGAVVKGENTLAFSAGDLKGGTYNWAIEIISNIEGEAPVLVYAGETPEQVVRGGVVTITDETVPAYGYTIVSHGKWQGFDVYDPAGEHVGTFHKGFKQSTNQSSPFRGAEREGLAVFADWSDATAGYWVVDPLNPTAEPYNLLAATGATVAGSGLYTTAEGVITAGGSAAIAFQGKGDDTVMYGFEEDRPDASNVVVAWPIGSAQYLTVAPKMIFSGATATSEIPTNEGGVNTKSRLANTNVDILAIENGFFCSQVRANGKEPATPPFIYVSNDGQEIMNAGMEEIMESATAGIAITKDRSLFAASMNDAIRFFTIEWDETGFPVMTKLADVEVPGLRWAQMRFDPANNLHVYARECGGYQVYALNGEGTASTAAPVELAITKQGDGISDIAVDAANGDAVYYNLNGVRIAAENLTPGVYVKVVNGKASKVVVK